MNSNTDVADHSAATDCSVARAFRVGDCVILNYCEQPCGRLVCVVVGDDGEFYHCQYLNADPVLDAYNDPPMKNRLERATKIETFGVVIRAADGEYWCEQREESQATYADGKPRPWQECGGPIKYRTRPQLADMLWKGKTRGGIFSVLKDRGSGP
jgi:hypothetical protein